MMMARAAGVAALSLLAMSDLAAAGDVTLHSRDGTVEIAGNLIGYDGEFYRVDTVYGVLTVDGSGVICDGPGCPNLEAYVAEIAISGARTMGEVLLPALIEAFAARNGYLIDRNIADDTHFGYTLIDRASGHLAARIAFRIGSTAEGFADLLADEADLALAVREPRADELRLARDGGLGDLRAARQARIVALDALVPIVSPSNPIREISLLALARIYSGKIDNWRALGGPDLPIARHLRQPQSGLTQLFEDRVMAPRGLETQGDTQRHLSNADLVDAVARDPAAIGVTAYSERGNAEPLALRGTCDFRSHARVLSIKTEDYPLTAPLFVYTPARRLPVLAREFLAYARSPAAQAVIQRAGFVNLRVDQIPLDAQGERVANAVAAAGAETPLIELQRLVKAMRGARRLTIGFRFEIGRTTLDAHSQSNIRILARLLEAGFFDGKTLTFAGFSDGDGPAAANLRLAERRAEAVRDAVLAAAPTADRDRLTLRVDAFGEAMPMACDDTEWGRQVNRRVEVWLR